MHHNEDMGTPYAAAARSLSRTAMQIANLTSNRTTEIQHFAALCAFDAYAEDMRVPIPNSSLPERFYQALDRELGRKAIPNEATSFYITFERALNKRNGMSSKATHWDNNIEEWREPTAEDLPRC
jgi:hypothetical protein